MAKDDKKSLLEEFKAKYLKGLDSMKQETDYRMEWLEKYRAQIDAENAANAGSNAPKGDAPSGGVVEDVTLGTPFDAFINEAGQKYNVAPYFIASIIKQESNFNPKAGSNAGAQGLMQLMPNTARGLGCDDPWDPKKNIMAGTNYISQMLNGQNGDPVLALAAYNAGPGNVKKYGGVPPFDETQKYVKIIPASFKTYTGKELTAKTARGGEPIDSSNGGGNSKLVGKKFTPPGSSYSGYHRPRATKQHARGTSGMRKLPGDKFVSNLAGCTMYVSEEMFPVALIIYEAMKNNNLLTGGRVRINSAYRHASPSGSGLDYNAHGWGGAMDIATSGKGNALRVADICWAIGMRSVSVGGNIQGGSGFIHVDIGPPYKHNYGHGYYQGPGTLR